MPLGQCDRARLVIDAYSIGLSGNELSAHLMSYNIEAEYASKNAVVLMASPFNRRNDFSKLETAISRAGFKGRAPLLYDSRRLLYRRKQCRFVTRFYRIGRMSASIWPRAGYVRRWNVRARRGFLL